jgi:ketosteroid isomerase-like protein
VYTHTVTGLAAVLRFRRGCVKRSLEEASMYRTIVAGRVRGVWRELQRHNADSVLKLLAPRFEHHVYGDHALAGARHGRDAQGAWFARIFRLFPDIRYTVREVVVSGWPWRTCAIAVIEVSVPSQPDYSNIVLQQLDLRWGRVTRIVNLEDTQALSALLTRLGESGNREALAPAIDDSNWADAE